MARGQRVSIRRSLFLRFGLLASVSVVLVALGYTFLGLRPVVERIAESHFATAVERVEASLSRLLLPVEGLIAMARDWARDPGFKADQADDFNRIFRPVLARSPHLTSVVAGTEDGVGWLLLQLDGERWRNRLTNIPARGQEQLFLEWQAGMPPVERREVVDYDPRRRPWFRNAMAGPADGSVHWTAPYTFFTTRDPGITASTRVDLGPGGALALGFDIKLLDISRATAEVRVGEHGYALVINSDGRLLGLPRGPGGGGVERTRKLVLEPASALAMPAVDAALAGWNASGQARDRILHFRVDGEDWLASFRPFPLGEQLFWVGVLAPESDFVPPWRRLALVLTGILLFVLALALLLARRYTRRFSVPLEALVRSSDRIARLDFAPGPRLPTNLEELERLSDAQEAMRGMLANFRDTVEAQSADLVRQVATLRATESRLEYLSQHDTLTGLPNRMLFNDRLQQCIARARRKGDTLAVLFIDLDHFKTVNDSEGHLVGDELLKAVAGRLAGCLRESDTLARLGGDEFTVLLEGLASAQDAAPMAEKLLRSLGRPVEIGTRHYHITGSIGVSTYPADGDDPVTLVRNADSAMYQAKGEGRNAFHFYSRDLTHRALQRLSMEEDLHRALELGGLEVHFQAQVDMDSRRITGIEALVRWRHPTLGLVSPADFIPLAEETGLINDIGALVLERSCRQWADWNAQGLRLPEVAVNVSVKQLLRGNLLATVDRVLAETALPRGILALEVTESLLLETANDIGVLRALRDRGVRLVVDDFGTGYSSLSYLRELSFGKLKIDRSFIDALDRGEESGALVRAIIHMAAALGLEVIAEGVETPAQAEFLLAAGCHLAQGYLYARPLPADQLRAAWAEAGLRLPGMD